MTSFVFTLSCIDNSVKLTSFDWGIFNVKGRFWLKFTGKSNRLKELLIFIVLANFVYFPCISDRNLLILLNLFQSYPAHKIDHLPHLRILSLYMDHSVLTGIYSLYPFLLFLFTPFVLLCLCEAWINALVCTIVYSLHRHSGVSNAWLHTPVYGSPFNLYSISHRILCTNCVEIWSFELLIFQDLTLVDHMQMNSPQISLIG